MHRDAVVPVLCELGRKTAYEASGVALRALLGFAATALAASMLAALASASAALASPNPGGAYSSPAPRVTSVKCRTNCAGPTYARPGSVLLLTGRDLEGTETVTFHGRKAVGDEVTIEPERVSSRRLTVRVPRDAASGRMTVVNGDGARSSATSRTVVRVERIATRRASSGPGPQIELGVSTRKAFFDGERLPTLTYAVRDQAPVHVVVDLVRATDGVGIARWDQGLVPPGEPRSVTWDGLVNGQVPPEGRYEFRVEAIDAGGVRASSSQAAPDAEGSAPSPDSFMFLAHKFPVRGAHDYGGYAAGFGGGRGHKGQDVFARCGTPLVAARGGVVKFKQYHRRAGHYVVIDGDHSDFDYVYMHLQEEALVGKGDRVHTGQQIGFVGDTGRAHGCHLHFELWSAPGWYSGGEAFDPLPELKAWDRFS